MTFTEKNVFLVFLLVAVLVFSPNLVNAWGLGEAEDLSLAEGLLSEGTQDLGPFRARNGSALALSRRSNFGPRYNNSRLIIGGTGGSIIARDFNTMAFGSPLTNPNVRRWSFGAESLRRGSAFRGSRSPVARGGFRGHGRR